eukprot:SAG22_NODE_7410_length_742_cov_1.429238_1_plen_222_part_10
MMPACPQWPALWLSFVLALTTRTATAQQCLEPVEPETEYRGADLAEGALNTPASSVSVCCARCRATTGCRGWSLCGLNNMCNLKSDHIDSLSPAEAAEYGGSNGAATRRTRNARCSSGYIPPPPKTGPPSPPLSPAPPPGPAAPSPPLAASASDDVQWMTVRQSTLVGQPVISVAPEGTLIDCQRHCAGTIGCFGFVRVAPVGQRHPRDISGSCRFYPAGVH